MDVPRYLLYGRPLEKYDEKRLVDGVEELYYFVKNEPEYIISGFELDPDSPGEYMVSDDEMCKHFDLDGKYELTPVPCTIWQTGADLGVGTSGQPRHNSIGHGVDITCDSVS